MTGKWEIDTGKFLRSYANDSHGDVFTHFVLASLLQAMWVVRDDSSVMLLGKLSDKLAPFLELSILSTDSTSRQHSFLVDTGCTLEMVLPAVILAELGWPVIETMEIQQADGSRVAVDLHEGSVVFGELARPVLAAALGTQPIIGMELLQGWQLCLDIIAPGEGEVRLQPL